MAHLKLGFLCSHRGSNMQAIIDACNAGRLDAQPRVVISNNSSSMALQRARDQGIPCYHLSGKTHTDAQELDKAILSVLKRHEVNLVILAGYMKKIGARTIQEFKGRMLNTHPALLPRYGGKGMFGRFVHEAVLASGDECTGVTIHVVDEEYDHGPIVAQCRVRVLPTDTVQTLSERVLQREHELFIETLEKTAKEGIFSQA